MRRRRRPVSRLQLFYTLVITGLVLGGSLWLDRDGVPVTGRVAAKQERIVVGHEPSGEWRRYYEVAAAFELPDGGGSQATVRVPQERYDALRAGDPIELRYLPQFPLLARTTDRSTASIVSELAWELAGIPILTWVVGGFLALWIAARMGTIPVLAAGAAWLAAGYSLLLSPPSREGPRPARAMAQVRGVTPVDKSPGRVYRTRRTAGFNRRLEIPYQVVELLVPLRGGRDTVLAVDAVDSGSVAGLANGAVLPVRLDPAAPRDAQLAAGTRRFVEANRYHFLIPVVGCAILGTLAALTYRWRRRKRQATSRDATVSRQGTATALRALLLLFGTESVTAQAQVARTPGSPRSDALARVTVGKTDAGTPPDRRYGAMHLSSRSTSATLVPALALGLVAWGGGSAGAAPCPTPTDIETTIGYPVRLHPQVSDRCIYELTGQYQGAFVALSYQPATRADDVYAEIRQRVKGAKGVNAQPDRLSLAEGGLAYGSMGKKEAAAVSQGQLYHVEMDYDFIEGLKLREDAAIRVVELAMRSASAGKSAASFDACMLATNAEVSQIAEEKPEIAKYWSAPAASLGGSHCDYDGGSIRVYQGQAAATAFDASLKAFKADKEPRTPVQGIGDKAFFMIPLPDDKYNRLGLLAVYAGANVVQLTLDAQGDEPIEATRPRLERLARLVLPRLRR